VFIKSIIILLSAIIFSIAFAEDKKYLPSSLVQEPEILIFVSFSMPEQSLKLWAEQASKINGKLLLRGFLENSWLRTTTKVQTLFDNNDVELFIDPEAFERFDIQTVPAVVVTEPDNCRTESCLLPSFDIVAGDTSVEDALKAILNKGSPSGKLRAQKLLQRYRVSHD